MDYRQAANERKYDLAASCYDLIAFLMSLGQAKNLYAKVAEKIDVESTRTVVELGCGPASVIPYLVDKVSNDTQIIGIDFSSKMIDIADRKGPQWLGERQVRMHGHV